MKDMSRQVNILDTYHNMDDTGNAVVPLEMFNEIKRRCVTNSSNSVMNKLKAIFSHGGLKPYILKSFVFLSNCALTV